jgi:hypothetical protein
VKLAGVGAGFVVCIALGLIAGVRLADSTGQSWWPIAGLFGGLLVGGTLAASLFRQALK